MKTYKVNDFFKDGSLEVDWDFVETVPEFHELRGKLQNPKWHAEGNAFAHTKIVAETMVRILSGKIDFLDTFRFNGVFPLMTQHTFEYRHRFFAIFGGNATGSLRLRRMMVCAALFHDIGKSAVTFLGKDGEWHAYGHEGAGEGITRRLLWGEELWVRETICALVRWHMEPLRLLSHNDPRAWYDKVQSDICQFSFVSAFNSNMENTAVFGWPELLLLKQCDIAGSIQKDEEQQRRDYYTLDFILREFCDTHIFAETCPPAMGKKCAEFFLEKPSLRKPKLCVVLMGLPGSGKNTFIEGMDGNPGVFSTGLMKYFDDMRNASGELEKESFAGMRLDSFAAVSRDDIRADLGFCRPGEKYIGSEKEESEVSEEFVRRVYAAAKANDVIIFNNMNNKRKYRDDLKRLLSNYRCFWHYVYVEAESVDINIERRAGYIPERVFGSMMEKWEMPDADEYNMLHVYRT